MDDKRRKLESSLETILNTESYRYLCRKCSATVQINYDYADHFSCGIFCGNEYDAVNLAQTYYDCFCAQNREPTESLTVRGPWKVDTCSPRWLVIFEIDRE